MRNIHSFLETADLTDDFLVITSSHPKYWPLYQRPKYKTFLRASKVRQIKLCANILVTSANEVRTSTELSRRISSKFDGNGYEAGGDGGCDWRMVMAMHQPQDKIISTANKSLKGNKIEWEHDRRTDGL